MSDLKQTETLVKKSVTVEVNGEHYVIGTFCLAKTIRAFQLISELAHAAGLGEAAKTSLQEDIVTGEVNVSLANIVGQLIKALPKLLADGVPAIYKLLGLIVTGNRELKRLEKADGVDVDQVLYEKGEEIAYYDDGVEGVMQLLSAAVQVMGTETIVGKLLPLLGLFRK